MARRIGTLLAVIFAITLIIDVHLSEARPSWRGKEVTHDANEIKPNLRSRRSDKVWRSSGYRSTFKSELRRNVDWYWWKQGWNDWDPDLSVTVPRNCAAWKKAGYTDNGKYFIDPDGPTTYFTDNGKYVMDPGPNAALFSVECVMNGFNGEAITVIHHDSEARIHAGNCEVARSCVRNVKYHASLQQIIALINISRECKQFIKYECFSSLFAFERGHNHAWFSRHGAAMDYWGGAIPGSKKCACGMLGRCDKPGLACNCDANDNVWRSDSGYLSDKSALPVTKMAFGDLSTSQGSGTDEDGYHQLGALLCFGTL